MIGCESKISNNNSSTVSQDPEYTYSEILTLISNEDWLKASEELNTLEPDYKGVKILKSIVYSNIALQEVSGNEFSDYAAVLVEMKKIPNKYNDIHSDLVNQYKKNLFDRISALELNSISNFIHEKKYDNALTAIQNSIFIYMDSSYIGLNKYSYAMKMKEKDVSVYYDFLYKIPKDYDGILNKEINLNKSEVESKLVDLIKKKKYEDVLKILGKYTQRDAADITFYAVRTIVKIRQDVAYSYRALAEIPDNYKGIMYEEIISYKEKYRGDLKAYSAELSYRERLRNQPAKPSPQIGMSPEEVNSSSWGSPEDKNRTTTKYGVSEQWVYGDGRYVYFNDGEVTTIQE